MYAFLSFILTTAHGPDDSQCGRQEGVINKLVDLRKAEKERQRRIQELERQISKLKEVLESPLETEDQEQLDAELVRLVQTWGDRSLRTPTEQRAHKERETEG